MSAVGFRDLIQIKYSVVIIIIIIIIIMVDTYRDDALFYICHKYIRDKEKEDIFQGTRGPILPIVPPQGVDFFMHSNT